MSFLIRLLITAAAAYFLSTILSGVHIPDFITAVVFAIVLAFLNGIVKPILILLTLPVTIITLGIFLFIINAFIVVIADKMMNSISIDNFKWALIFSLGLSLISSVAISTLERDEDHLDD